MTLEQYRKALADIEKGAIQVLETSSNGRFRDVTANKADHYRQMIARLEDQAQA